MAKGVPSPLFESVGGKLDELDAERLEVAFRAGDPAVVALWNDTIAHLASSVGNTITLFNPRVVVFGGGVLAWAPSIKAGLVAALPRFAGRPAMQHVQIRQTTLGDEAGVLGAACLAWESYAAAVSPHR